MRKLRIRIICCLCCRHRGLRWQGRGLVATALYKQVLMADLNARLMAESSIPATAQQRHTYMGLHKILRLLGNDGELHWMLFNSAMRVAQVVVAVSGGDGAGWTAVESSRSHSWGRTSCGAADCYLFACLLAASKWISWHLRVQTDSKSFSFFISLLTSPLSPAALHFY